MVGRSPSPLPLPVPNTTPVRSQSTGTRINVQRIALRSVSPPPNVGFIRLSVEPPTGETEAIETCILTHDPCNDLPEPTEDPSVYKLRLPRGFSTSVRPGGTLHINFDFRLWMPPGVSAWIRPTTNLVDEHGLMADVRFFQGPTVDAPLLRLTNVSTERVYCSDRMQLAELCFVRSCGPIRWDVSGSTESIGR
jgi:hypothetical protein